MKSSRVSSAVQRFQSRHGLVHREGELAFLRGRPKMFEGFIRMPLPRRALVPPVGKEEVVCSNS